MAMAYGFLVWVTVLYIKHILNGSHMQIGRKAFNVDDEDSESYWGL